MSQCTPGLGRRSTLVDDWGLGVPNSILRLLAADKAKTEDACAKVWGEKTGRMWVGSSLLLVLEMKSIQGKLEYLGGGWEWKFSKLLTRWFTGGRQCSGLGRATGAGSGSVAAMDWKEAMLARWSFHWIVGQDFIPSFGTVSCQLSKNSPYPSLSSKNAVFFHVSWDKVNTGLQHTHTYIQLYVYIYNIYTHIFCATFMAVKSESNPSLENTRCSPEALG